MVLTFTFSLYQPRLSSTHFSLCFDLDEAIFKLWLVQRVSQWVSQSNAHKHTFLIGNLGSPHDHLTIVVILYEIIVTLITFQLWCTLVVKWLKMFTFQTCSIHPHSNLNHRAVLWNLISSWISYFNLDSWVDFRCLTDAWRYTPPPAQLLAFFEPSAAFTATLALLFHFSETSAHTPFSANAIEMEDAIITLGYKLLRPSRGTGVCLLKRWNTSGLLLTGWWL